MGLSRALGGRKSIVGKSKKKKQSIRFSSFFSFGVIFRSPGVGSQLSHPLSLSRLRVAAAHSTLE
jgi:hypothetical protein